MNLFNIQSVNAPVPVRIPVNPGSEQKITIWYKPTELSPARTEARGMVANWVTFHETLADWDLTIPNNILEVWKQNAEVMAQVSEKTEQAMKPKVPNKEYSRLLDEVEELKKGLMSEPAPDFSSGETKIPLERGIIAQVPLPLLNLMSKALNEAMFPNRDGAEESESSFSE